MSRYGEDCTAAESSMGCFFTLRRFNFLLFVAHVRCTYAHFDLFLKNVVSFFSPISISDFSIFRFSKNWKSPRSSKFFFIKSTLLDSPRFREQGFHPEFFPKFFFMFFVFNLHIVLHFSIQNIILFISTFFYVPPKVTEKTTVSAFIICPVRKNIFEVTNKHHPPPCKGLR